MIHRIFLAVYILTVLFIAGFARADVAIPHGPLKKLHITHAEFNQKDFTIVLNAQSTNTCENIATPHITYKGDSADTDVLELSVVVESVPAFCGPAMNQVEVTFDLERMEEELLRLGLDPLREYVLAVPGTEVNIVVNLNAQVMEQEPAEVRAQRNLEAFLNKYHNNGNGDLMKTPTLDIIEKQKRSYNNNNNVPLTLSPSAKSPILLTGAPAYP